MAEISEEVLALIAEHPWQETIPKLVLYASWKMKERYWFGILGGPAPKGKEAEDMVLDCINKVLEGNRVWNPKNEPDLYFYLMSVLDSDINHLVTGWENTHFFRNTTHTDNDDQSDFLNTIGCPNPGPEALLLQKECEQHCEKFFWAFHDYLKETPALQKMLECIVDGWTKRSEIAEQMGVTVKELDNLKKQMQRRLKAFQEQDFGGKKQ